MELSYLYTVAAGCFLVCRLKQSTRNVIMTDEENCRKKNAIGLLLINNWDGFVSQTWQPWMN